MNILMYSHDTYGLGHLRRTMSLARSMLGPGRNIVILTGSPIIGRFELPQGIDFVRVPGMMKHADDLYLPAAIKVAPEMALEMRQSIILATAKAFRPDVVIIDKAPLGLKREIVPTLRWLRDKMDTTKVVLGLRDIMDSPQSTIDEWRKKNIYQVLDELYSEIWVYGDQQLYDPVKEYAIPPQVAAKIHFTGYIPRKMVQPEKRPQLRRTMNIGPKEKLVVVTAGGGGDGYKVIDTYLTMLENGGVEFKSMIVAGPLMGEAHYDQLAARAHKLRVRICKFHRKMEKVISAADCVVSMGGYNTLCEIISASRPSLILPRSTPRQEQAIRARIFAERGLLEYIPWEEVGGERMLAKIRLLLDQSASYEQQLQGFAMTAFEVIASRIATFGEPQ
jgi:predicted glycosyltransferase